MMKYCTILIFGLLVAFSTVAQTKSEKAVGTAVTKLADAMVNADSLTLEALTSDQLSYGHSSGLVEGKKSFIQKLTSGKSDFVNIDLTEQSISIIGKTAIVRHILNAKTNDKGVPGEVHLKVLLVWQKQKSKWKLIARQAVKLA